MNDRPDHTLSIAPGDGPPPPLAGALSAWWSREGCTVRVVRGFGPVSGDLWVHLEGEPGEDRFDVPDADVHFFGPGVEDPAVRDAIRRARPTAEIVRGDPEPGGVPDLADLPITTWEGFEPLGGAFRLLAGRGSRPRSLGHLLREVVYLVETHEAGHLIFDDADLAVFPGWRSAFEDELARLPWELSWEGTFHAERVRLP